MTVCSVIMSGQILFIWGAPIIDKDGQEIPDEFSILPSWQAYPRRAWKEMHFFKQMIQEPSSQKLLPDPLKEPWYQVRTDVELFQFLELGFLAKLY